MNLNRRITQLEEIHTPREKPTACVATIQVDGSAKLSYKGSKVEFKNRDELNRYVEEQGIDKRYLLIVELVNAQKEIL